MPSLTGTLGANTYGLEDTISMTATTGITGPTGGNGNGLLNGLQSYYKFDTNGSFPDAQGSNNGTISGATFTASGKINGGYDFDGINDEITCGTIAAVSKSSAFTMSIWFQADTTGSTRTLISHNLGSADRIGMQIVNSELRCAIFNGVSYFVITNTAFSDTSSFHLLIMKFDGASTLTTKLDDVLFSGGTNQPSLSASVQELSFGIKADNTGDYDGRLDESGIWDVETTDDQDTALWNEGNGLSFDSFTS